MPSRNIIGWWSVHMPKGTPKPILDQLETLFNQIAVDEETKKFLANLGSDPLPGNSQMLKSLLVKDTEAWQVNCDFEDHGGTTRKWVMVDASQETQLLGHLAAIHGSVVDIRFSEGVLPAVNEAIAIERHEGAPLVAEVQQHLDSMTVRAVALGNSAGLSRGASARALGAPIRVPVGGAVLGRLLNAVGEPADRGPELPVGTP